MHFLTVITALSLLPSTFASPAFHRGHNKQIKNFKVGQIVKTSSGSITGHASTTYSEVSEYLGIPYAKPPVGDLRFAAPVAYTSSSIFNGSTFGNACPTTPSTGGVAPTPELIAFSNVTAVGLELFSTISNPPVAHSEDCLFLNVWAKPQCGEEKKAVMVFIHGGGFSGGTASSPTFDGASLVEREDVIIVTLNYRISVLGFPGNPAAQNNLAFLDQRLAVEWVRDNIANFGGDVSRITLFGQSAGGASADYYSYAYASDPIIAGQISQSGTVFAFGLPYSAAAASANWYSVTSTLGCGNASTDATAQLACMRNVSSASLLAAVPTSGLSALLSPFGPAVDNKLVFANYSLQAPARIPVMVGSNDYEAGTFRTQLALGNVTFADSDWEEMNLASYTCPTAQRANASISSSLPIWRYRYHGVFPNTDISSEGGAYHGAELPLIFGTTSKLINDTSEEIAIESYIQGSWAAFAKDPVKGLTRYEGGWPAYNPNGESLVRLAYWNLTGTNAVLPNLYDAGCATASLTDLFCRVLGYCV